MWWISEQLVFLGHLPNVSGRQPAQTQLDQAPQGQIQPAHESDDDINTVPAGSFECNAQPEHCQPTTQATHPGHPTSSNPGTMQCAEVPASSVADLEGLRGSTKKRKRVKAKQQQLTQEELDARHPGNARNRAALEIVSTAWEQYQQEQRQEHHHQQQQQQQQQAHVQGDGTALTAACEQQVAAQQQPDLTDWVSLYEMRQVVKPKICVDHVQFDLFGSLVCNDSPSEVVAAAHDTRVVMPPNSAFLMTDVSIRNSLKPLLDRRQPYQCIVADPPWENASVKRSGRYLTLPSHTLLSLPVAQLLDQESGLLLLWITNRERLHRFVHDELLPQWGLQHVATWYWLKLTPDGTAPVSSLTSMHRHPFEPILVCAPTPSQPTAEPDNRPPPPPASPPPVPQNLVLMSARDAQHSRKPHLGPVLDKLRPGWRGSGGGCLELFAREMHAGWTSVGNEVLRFQELHSNTKLG